MGTYFGGDVRNRILEAKQYSALYERWVMVYCYCEINHLSQLAKISWFSTEDFIRVNQMTCRIIKLSSRLCDIEVEGSSCIKIWICPVLLALYPSHISQTTNT